MRHGLRATLGPIVQGLLAVGLCTLAAGAQQSAAPTEATAPAHAVNTKPDAKTKQDTTARPADNSAAPAQGSRRSDDRCFKPGPGYA